MYVANVKATNQWANLETLISTATETTFTFDSSTTYHITNNSDYSVYLVNQDDAPTAIIDYGMKLPAGAQCDFKPGASTKLWAMSCVTPIDLCIEQEN